MPLTLTKVLEGSSWGFEVQYLEIVDGYVLVRLRVGEGREAYADGRTSLLRGGLFLSDASGIRVEAERTASSGEGPFRGVIDIAFPAVPLISLRGVLMLEAEDIRVRFIVAQADPAEVRVPQAEDL